MQDIKCSKKGWGSLRASPASWLQTHKFATDFSDKHFEQKYTSQSSEKQPSKVSACQHCDLIVYVCLS